MQEFGDEMATYHAMGYRLAETPGELTQLQQVAVALLSKKLYGEKVDG